MLDESLDANAQSAAGSLRSNAPTPALPAWKVWMMAARPRTLPASAAPVLVGTAAAIGDGRFRLLPALAALLGSALIQIGTNLANDVFDGLRGTDGPGRLGPVRVTAAGLLAPRQVMAGMMLIFALAVAVGVYLVWVGGWPIVWIGTLGILSGILYTGGPWPLGYHGLGDLFVFIFFGPVAVGGTCYVQAGTVNPRVLAAGAAVGALATAILVVNNLRDRVTDARVGKRTLAVRLGEGLTRRYYLMLLAVAYCIAILLSRSWIGLLPLLSMPIAAGLIRVVNTKEDGPSLNEALAGTAKLLALFSLLWIPGWL